MAFGLETGVQCLILASLVCSSVPHRGIIKQRLHSLQIRSDLNCSNQSNTDSLYGAMIAQVHTLPTAPCTRNSSSAIYVAQEF
jgi:hypothetical protein